MSQLVHTDVVVEEQRSGMSADERRNMRLLLVGQTASVVGTQTTGVALPLLATGLAGVGSFAVSLIVAARYLPFLFLSIPAGLLADRLDARRLMIGADLSRLALMAALPLLYATGELSIAAIVGIVTLVTTARVVFDLSLSKLIVSRFNDRSWLTVNSRVDAFTNTGGLAGPPLAGAVAGAIGAVWALVLDAVTYVASLVTLMRMRAPQSPDTALDSRGPAGGRATMSAAARLIWQHKVLRCLVAGGALSNFALMTLQGVSVVYMVREVHMSSLATGLVVGCLGVGSAVGAAIAPHLINRWRLRPLIAVLAPAAALGPLSLSAAPMSVAIPFFGYAAMGAAIAIVGIVGRRYRQGQIPPEVFGSASGVYSTVLMGTLPIGSITGGIISELVGFTTVLWVSVAGFGCAALSYLMALRMGFRSQM